MPAATSGVLGGHRVVPVVVLDDVGKADELGAALAAGGLPVAEATFRTPEAAAVLRRLAERSDLLVGAGTVITAAQVDLAHDAGARFVVSPGLSATVVRRCQELDLPVFPGVSTASEIIAALDLGVETVKFFPAEASGGLGTIKALSAAFPQVRFVPTGGITARDRTGLPGPPRGRGRRRELDGRAGPARAGRVGRGDREVCGDRRRHPHASRPDPQGALP